MIDLLIGETASHSRDLGYVLSVDALLTERHELVSRVSQYPIEDGAVIADHILNEPRRVSLEGFVSDTPLTPFPSIVTAVADAIAGVEETPSAEAFRLLEALREDRSPITLVTGLKRYRNMVMTNLVIPRDVKTGRALQFSADFVEIQVVDTEVVTIDAQAGKPTQQGAGEADLGKQTPQDVSGSEAKSLAKHMQEGFTDLLEVFDSELLRMGGGK